MRLTPAGLRAHGHRLPCTVGRSGVTAAKQEGDGATPAGLHRIVQLLWRPDRLGRPSWPHRAARPIRPGEIWCEDPGDAFYNQRVRRPGAVSEEHLRRPDPLYDLILVLDWNAAGTPGRGSAIFVHRRRRPGAPTAGCLALSARDLRRLAERTRPGDRLIVPAPTGGPSSRRERPGASGGQRPQTSARGGAAGAVPRDGEG